MFVHQTAIQADGFRSLDDGEQVEFKVEISKRSGKPAAVDVTGPGGANVVGKTKQQQDFW